MIRAKLSGVCASGAELGHGTLVHLVDREGFGKALCGAKPGRRSALGFVRVPASDGVYIVVTCGRCERRYARARGLQ